MKVDRSDVCHSGFSFRAIHIYLQHPARALPANAFLGTRVASKSKFRSTLPNDRPCRIFIDDGGELFGSGISTESFPICDQYTIQGDVFSKAIRHDGEVPVPLGDAVKNMAVIEAIFRSAESGRWETPSSDDRLKKRSDDYGPVPNVGLPRPVGKNEYLFRHIGC